MFLNKIFEKEPGLMNKEFVFNSFKELTESYDKLYLKDEAADDMDEDIAAIHLDM
jgi:hypothetical protein